MTVERAIRDGDQFAMPESLFVEFLSVLRKQVTRGRLSSDEANIIRDELLAIPVVVLPTGAATLRRAWELAVDLNQSDVFDALGYAAAEAYDAEFWTSDARFANAAQGAGLPRLRHVS